LLGSAGAIGCTALFALGGGLPIFTLAWALNRLLQSTGWPGAVKLTSRWFSYSSYGAAMGFISLSYLNPPKNTPSIAPAWMEMNLASWAFRPRLTRAIIGTVL
jgi:sugar phosphate permease